MKCKKIVRLFMKKKTYLAVVLLTFVSGCSDNASTALPDTLKSQESVSQNPLFSGQKNKPDNGKSNASSIY